MDNETKETVGTALTTRPPSASDLDDLREAGRVAIARQREIQRVYKVVRGLTWGDVRGAALSPHAQAALAEFCVVTGANPLIHMDMLGGRPYLNASYWSDRVNRDPLFVDLRQRDLSPAAEEAHRTQAQEIRAAIAADPDLPASNRGTMLMRAVELEAEARDLALARANWGAPDWATAVWETRIRRFMNAAPMDAIRAGEITDPAILNGWIVEVAECNWAGGRKTQETDRTFRADPIGDAFPSLTARTRSLRRCACRAFSAWGAEYEEAIRSAEAELVSDFAVLTGEPVDDAPRASDEDEDNGGGGSGPSVVVGGGAEPRTPAPPRAPASSGDDDRAQIPELRKRLFATFGDAGVSEDSRKAWSTQRGFPASTKEWAPAQYEAAVTLLMRKDVQKYQAGCNLLGLDAEDFALRKLGRLPDTLRDYQDLNAALSAEADAGEADA